MIGTNVTRYFVILLSISISCVVFYIFESIYVLDPSYSAKLVSRFRNEQLLNTLSSTVNDFRRSPSIFSSEKLQKLYPNVPIHFLYYKKAWESQFCNSSQKENEIDYNEHHDIDSFGIRLDNRHWQKYESKNVKLYLYNAYLDNRRSDGNGSSIRITSMDSPMLTYNATNYVCLIWFNISTDAIVYNTSLEKELITSGSEPQNTSKYVPYLLTCKLPLHYGQLIPQAVSIVEDGGKKSSCFKPSNYLKVIYNNEYKKDFAVNMGISIIC